MSAGGSEAGPAGRVRRGLSRLGRGARRAALAAIGRDEDWGYRDFSPPGALLGWLARGAVLVADYVIVSVTATTVLPSVAMVLHRSAAASGADLGVMNTEGLIALYAVPYAFAALVLLAGELVLMRAMWRGTGRLVVRLRERRTRSGEAGSEASAASGGSGARPARGSKRKSKSGRRRPN